jgi:hypothetical protein
MEQRSENEATTLVIRNRHQFVGGLGRDREAPAGSMLDGENYDD